MDKPDSGTATLEEETPAAEDKKEEQSLTKTKEEGVPEDKKNEPQPGSERWNEVYRKSKTFERMLTEKEKDIEALREHNKALEARMNEWEKKKDVPEKEPDPEVDPAGYKKWRDHKEAEREKQREQEREQQRLDMQIEVQKEIHEDYVDMVKLAEKLMDRDAKLRKQVYGADNPAKEAYKLGKKYKEDMDKLETDEKELKKTKEQVNVESGASESGEAPTKETDLTDEQKRVARNLFPDIPFEEAKKKYKSQLKSMGRA
jgi:hypothetical protein